MYLSVFELTETENVTSPATFAFEVEGMLGRGAALFGNEVLIMTFIVANGNGSR